MHFSRFLHYIQHRAPVAEMKNLVENANENRITVITLM